MKITVRLFASYREIVGQTRLDVEVPEGATAGDLLRMFVERYPRLGDLAGGTLLAVNRDYAGAETQLRESDEVAFVPPVSGGAGG
ncbi:MAG: molybdopterin converting factor subunit 1 [Chloroflexota bacterium]|nr:MAG: molybdopterin converting factor subunit 1 [Chloroflexota bacterium]